MQSHLQKLQPEHAFMWWDITLDAERWWQMKSVSPREAAALLCRFNPFDSKSNPETDSADVTTPGDFIRLLRLFEDAATTDPKSRPLRQWHDLAKRENLKYHPWIDEWLSLKASCADRDSGTVGESAAWKAEAWRLADEIALERWKQGQMEITSRAIAKAVAMRMAGNSDWWGTQGPRTANTIRTGALKGWKFIPSSNGLNGRNGLSGETPE